MCMCTCVCVCVCLVGKGNGKEKCHTPWEARGFDVAHAPSPILGPKVGEAWEGATYEEYGWPAHGRSMSQIVF